MLTYTEIRGNKRRCLALTGLTPSEFDLLLPAFDRCSVSEAPESTRRAPPLAADPWVNVKPIRVQLAPLTSKMRLEPLPSRVMATAPASMIRSLALRVIWDGRVIVSWSSEGRR